MREDPAAGPGLCRVSTRCCQRMLLPARGHARLWRWMLIHAAALAEPAAARPRSLSAQEQFAGCLPPCPGPLWCVHPREEQQDPQSWSPCPGGAGTQPSAPVWHGAGWGWGLAVAARRWLLLRLSGRLGALLWGAGSGRRGLGWLLWLLSVRQEVAWKKTALSWQMHRGELATLPPPPLAALVPLLALPWPGAEQHSAFPIDYPLPGPIAHVALGWSCQNLGQTPAS